MNQSIETLFDDLRLNHVKCLMIRPKALNEPSLYTGDIDILISPNAYLSFILCVKNVCRKGGLSFYVERKKQSKLELSIFDLSSDLEVKFDLWLFLDICFSRNKKYISWSTLVDKGAIIKNDGSYSLEKNFAALFYVSHLHSKKKDLNNLEVKQRISYFLETRPSDKVCFYLNNLNKNTYSKVYDYFSEGCFFEPFITPIIRKIHYELNVFLQFSDSCVIGPDGVGKGTIIDLMMKKTESKYYRYKKTFRKSLLYIIHHLFFRDKGDSKNVHDEKNRKSLFWFSLFRSYLVIILNLGQKSFIFDRYFYDLLIDGLRSDSIQIKKGNDLSSKIKLIPKLKTIIQLDAPANVIRARKAELTDDKVDALSDLYLECAIYSQSKYFLYLNTDEDLVNINDFLEKLINERHFLKR